MVTHRGLYSRDSAQIMDILKELTYAGQLVFAVLHQPSSLFRCSINYSCSMWEVIRCTGATR